VKGLKDIVKRATNTVAGIAAAPGIVIGKAHLFHKEILSVNEQDIVDVEEAVENFREALGKAKKELTKIFDLAHEKMGSERAEIFSAQLMILDDPVLQESIEGRIRKEKKHPDFIVQSEITKYQDLMIVANEDYLKERALDIEDIKNRVIRNLQKKRLQSKITQGVIVVSESLTPADTLLFSKWDAKAYVTDRGGLTSHAAILARSLDIPAIVGTHDGSHHINQDDLLIVDGFHGYVFVNPTEEQLAFYNDKIHHMQLINEELKELKDKPAQTVDKKIISIQANVDVSGEIEVVVTNGAEGIGLYRTEQIIEENGELPTEEEQYTIYSRLAQRIYPRMVTIRAFDTGGDKVKIWDFKESNPFLGLRGIRFLLENRAMFKAQLRALLRANIHDNLQLMLPMISSVEEIRQTKFLIRECLEELKQEKKPTGKKMRLGIMIEVPSAAVMAYEYAKEVDFLSIGTNDLIQYLMAVDRGNDHVSYLYQEFHPAVLRTIAGIIKDGKRANVVVSMCGEMAADNLALPVLLGLGLESISVAASAIPSIKRTIRALSYEKAKVLADECLTASHEVEVIALINKFFKTNEVPRTRNII